MVADVVVTDPRVEPIAHPPDQSISVHLRSSRPCGAGSACAARRVGSRIRAGSRKRCDGRRSRSGKAPASRFKGSVRNGLNCAVGPGFAAGSGGAGGNLAFQGTTINVGRNRGVAGGAASSRVRGVIRENVDSGFGVGGAAGSGFMGMIRENVDSGFCADAPPGRPADAVARPRLAAAALVCRTQTPRRVGGVISRIASGGCRWTGWACGATRAGIDRLSELILLTFSTTASPVRLVEGGGTAPGRSPTIGRRSHAASGEHRPVRRYALIGVSPGLVQVVCGLGGRKFGQRSKVCWVVSMA
jgi:hypothetical protein